MSVENHTLISKIRLRSQLLIEFKETKIRIDSQEILEENFLARIRFEKKETAGRKSAPMATERARMSAKRSSSSTPAVEGDVPSTSASTTSKRKRRRRSESKPSLDAVHVIAEQNDQNEQQQKEKKKRTEERYFV